MKIAMFSFADIDNYGDILFSHIFKMEIEKRIPDVQIDFYCPSSVSIEGLDYKAYERAAIDKQYDALVLAGGEVIHLFDERTWRPIYDKNGQRVLTEKPSDVVWDWIDIEGPYKAWISVGVRPFESEWDSAKIEKTIASLDFLSVRGSLSKKILEGMELNLNDQRIRLTPDMGWLFPEFLELKKAKGKLYSRYIQESEYLVFQINNINPAEAGVIAAALVAFQEREGIPVYLLPVIRPWEDRKYLELIRAASNNTLEILPNNLSILEIADIIVHSKYVLCSSLHAAITALAAGIPAAIINKWQGTKLQDIFAHQFRLHMLAHDFEKIPELLENLKQEHNSRGTLVKYAAFMRSSLDDLFDGLVRNILNRPETRY